MGKILDTRDLQERLEELEAEYEALTEALTEAEEALKATDEPDDDEKQAFVDARDAKEEYEDGPEFEELEDLRSMSEEIYTWKDGEALIPVNDWIDYVQELLEDLGYISKDFPWWIKIDWEATADNVAMDYSTITYQGEDYYYRNS